MTIEDDSVRTRGSLDNPDREYWEFIRTKSTLLAVVVQEWHTGIWGALPLHNKMCYA